MSAPKDGGQAFPSSETQFSNPVPGMSLRDWFAGQALAGQCSIEDERQCTVTDPQEVKEWRRECIMGDATYCYELADAMLAAREATV